MGQLTGKVAVVTGASKGIGAAIAKGLAAAGASVVVNYATSRSGADEVVQAITREGGVAIAVQGDVAQSADMIRLFKETKQRFNSLDILVNNAGVYQFAPLEDVTEAEFHRQFNTNVLGLLLATQEAAKHFSAKGGNVINISSVASLNPMPNASIYAATKGAVDAITQSLAKEHGPKNIRVNAINPGVVATEGTETAGVLGSDFEKQIVATTPLGRVGRPEDIASIATFLASPESGWLTGEIIAAAGGYR